MRNESHKTPIGIIREHLDAWRKDNDWSRETLATVIVEAHERIGANKTTGIKFEPPTTDAHERAKVNADRIFRWLDDISKDNNLATVNFLPSILAAMPIDRRTGLLNEMLVGNKITCRALVTDVDNESPVALFKSLVQVSGEASSAMADLIDGIDPGELERAHAALLRAKRELGAALHLVETRLAERSSQP